MSLITIDQLLESVDLDFEPRFVTKDYSDTISIFAERPECLQYVWCGHKLENFGRIKLAEFDGKDWTECIYEVPRKTTGEIEKLNEYAGNMQLSSASMTRNQFVANTIMKKINELVDAVNKHADIIQQIGEWASSKGECLWCETLTKFEPSELKRAKNG